MYLSQSMRNQWYGGMFQEESSEEDNDTIKVISRFVLSLTRSKTKHLFLFKENFNGHESVSISDYSHNHACS